MYHFFIYTYKNKYRVTNIIFLIVFTYPGFKFKLSLVIITITIKIVFLKEVFIFNKIPSFTIVKLNIFIFKRIFINLIYIIMNIFLNITISNSNLELIFSLKITYFKTPEIYFIIKSK